MSTQPQKRRLSLSDGAEKYRPELVKEIRNLYPRNGYPKVMSELTKEEKKELNTSFLLRDKNKEGKSK